MVEQWSCDLYFMPVYGPNEGVLQHDDISFYAVIYWEQLQERLEIEAQVLEDLYATFSSVMENISDPDSDDR